MDSAENLSSKKNINQVRHYLNWLINHELQRSTIIGRQRIIKCSLCPAKGHHRDQLLRDTRHIIIAWVWKTPAGSTLCLLTLDYSVFLTLPFGFRPQSLPGGWCGWPRGTPDFKSSLNPSSSAYPKFCMLPSSTTWQAVGSCFHLLCPQSSLCYSGDLFTPGSSTHQHLLLSKPESRRRSLLSTGIVN